MTRIALVSTQIIPRDAVGNDMLVMHRILRERGHEVAFFADYWDVHDTPVRYLREIPDYLRGPNDVLLYHHCTAWDGGPDLFRRLRCRKIVRYHNVTPAHFFAGYDAAIYRLAMLGREDLKRLVGHTDKALGDSEFNRQELEDLGFDNTGVFPIAVDTDRITHAPRRPAWKPRCAS